MSKTSGRFSGIQTPGNHGQNEGGTCPDCGCDIGQVVGSRAKHQEWHETMTQAIREQVEEYVANEFEKWRLENVPKTIPIQNFPNSPNSIIQSSTNTLADCINCGHSYSLHYLKNGYQSYGRCNHGHDLCSCSNYQAKALSNG